MHCVRSLVYRLSMFGLRNRIHLLRPLFNYILLFPEAFGCYFYASIYKDCKHVISSYIYLITI